MINKRFKFSVFIFLSTFSLFAFTIKESELIIDEVTGEGLARDAQQYCYPIVVDWDGDGVDDILLGVSHGEGTVRFYKNYGSNQEKRFNGYSNLEADDSLIVASMH